MTHPIHFSRKYWLSVFQSMKLASLKQAISFCDSGTKWNEEVRSIVKDSCDGDGILIEWFCWIARHLTVHAGEHDFYMTFKWVDSQACPRTAMLVCHKRLPVQFLQISLHISRCFFVFFNYFFSLPSVVGYGPILFCLFLCLKLKLRWPCWHCSCLQGRSWHLIGFLRWAASTRGCRGRYRAWLWGGPCCHGDCTVLRGPKCQLIKSFEGLVVLGQMQKKVNFC